MKVMVANPEQAARILFFADYVNTAYQPGLFAEARAGRYPITVVLVGAPGEGKTMTAIEYARLRDWPLWMMRTGSREVPELEGLPEIRVFEDGGRRVVYIHPDDFPDVAFEGRGVAVIDEFDRQSSTEALNVMSSFVLDGRIGQYQMPAGIQRVGTMNGATDEYTIPLPEFARQRMCLIYMDERSPDGWRDNFARPRGLHEAVVSFMESNWHVLNEAVEFEDMAAKYKKRKRCATFASDILSAALEIENKGIATADIVPLMLQGYFGLVQTVRLLAHCHVGEELPTLDDIRRKPLLARVPQDPAMQTTVATMVASSMNGSHQREIVQYLVRLRRDIADFGFRQVGAEVPGIFAEPAYLEWKNRGDEEGD